MKHLRISPEKKAEQDIIRSLAVNILFLECVLIDEKVETEKTESYISRLKRDIFEAAERTRDRAFKSEIEDVMSWCKSMQESLKK